MNFENKVVLITGGARGIGKSITARFFKGGAKVAIWGRNLEVASAYAKELSPDGSRAKAYGVDISDGAKLDAGIEEVLKDFGTLDVLVNNAGVTKDGLLARMTDEAWNEVINTNLTGCFRLMRAVARPMMKARSGSIVNVSSVVGLIGNAGQANYCAAKAGLIGLTKSAARELAPRNIRVNAIAPGFTETDMTSKLTEDQKKAALGTVPLARMGKPDEVAAAVAFLASEDAGYITGQVLSVCGGMAM